jgi:hypothetical protein
MSNVTKLYPADAAKDPDNVLEQAIGVYDEVLIIGWDKDGELDARADLTMTAREINWIMDVFKSKLLNGDYSDDECL